MFIGSIERPFKQGQSGHVVILCTWYWIKVLYVFHGFTCILKLNGWATMVSVMCGKGYRTWLGLFWYTSKHSDYIAQPKHHPDYVAQCKDTYLQGGHYSNNGFLPLYHCNLVLRLGKLALICSGHDGSPIGRLSTIWTNSILQLMRPVFMKVAFDIWIFHHENVVDMSLCIIPSMMSCTNGI